MKDPSEPPRQVLSDPRAEQQLHELGVTQTTFLSRAEVDELTALYDEVTPDGDHGLTVDFMRPDREHVARVMSAIEHVVTNAVNETFVDHRIVMSTFVVKHHGESSQMFLHDDRSYVDERVFRAATMWIPLVDIGPSIPNGALSVVPRSHLLPIGWSGSNTPDAIRPFESTLRQHLEPVEITAGDAVIYDTRVLHASAPNLSDCRRIAVAVALAPAEAQLYHVVATGRRGRNLHAVDTDFFRNHHPRDTEREMPTQYPVVERVLDPSNLTESELLAALDVDGPAVRELVLPDDLQEFRDVEPLDMERDCATPPADDVRITGLDEHDDHPQRATISVTSSQGSTATAPMQRNYRPQHHGLELPVESQAPDADVIVLEPGARMTAIALTSPRWEVRFEVVESPTVGSGIIVGARGANVQPGDRFSCRSNETVQAWNDGPGQLIIVSQRVAPGGASLPQRAKRSAIQLLNRLRPT